MDPYYAANAFYDALVKIPGYESLEITEAAQRVQRSAYPPPTPSTRTWAAPSRPALTGQTPGGRATARCAHRSGPVIPAAVAGGTRPRRTGRSGYLDGRTDSGG